MSFIKATGHVPSNRISQTLLGLVANWVEALHGQFRLEDVAKSIVLICNADTGYLVREERRSERMRWFAVAHREETAFSAGKATLLLDRVMGPSRFSAKPGTIWKLSESAVPHRASDPYPACADIYVVVLGHTATDVDYLELQFRNAPRAQAEDVLQQLAPTLAACWERRPTGCVLRHLSDLKPRQVTQEDTPAPVPIMDMSNPMNLSRSEFRVCAMVKEGKTTKRIARSLSVHEATVRSHLSSIYAKTATSGIVELIHRLNAGQAAGDKPASPLGARSSA